MKKVFCLLFIQLFCVCSLQARAIKEKETSFPYLSGNTFRYFCKHIFDERNQNLDAKSVKRGEAIFVKTDMLPRFFSEVHPLIKQPYILISHNSDHGAPGVSGAYLDDPKILAWFAQNVELKHEKLHPIPIGIANQCWQHGDVSLLREKRKRYPFLQERSLLLYLNFCPATYPLERPFVYDHFSRLPFCVVEGKKEFGDYLEDVGKSAFVLSPRGNGLDTHRTWEALYLGAIPIVKRSTMDAALEGLPVLFIDEWSEVTEDFLHEKLEEMRDQTYRFEKLFMPYWQKLIRTLGKSP